MSVQRKKQFEVIRSTTAPLKGIAVGGKMHKFDKNGKFVTHDAGKAQEIEDMYGYGAQGVRSVVVAEVDDLDPQADNRGGKAWRRTFSVPKLPWKDE